MKTYRWPRSIRGGPAVTAPSGNPAPIAPGQNGWLLFLTALSVLITPIVVAIITSNTSKSSTDKDYVNIAVTILNSKNSTAENRKWALQVLNKLSPVPFSAAGNEGLESGGGLYTNLGWGPNNPLVKKGSKFSDECPDIKSNTKKIWGQKEMAIYINEISDQYQLCAIRHHWGLLTVDNLQNTRRSAAALTSENWKAPAVVRIK